MIIKANGSINAGTVAKENGFIDTTPETSLFTKKIFALGNKTYRFNGWCDLVDRSYKSIEMVEI